MDRYSVTPDQHTPSRDFACAPTPWIMAQVTPHNYITHTSHITHTSRTHNPYLTPCVRSRTSRHIRGATSPVHNQRPNTMLLFPHLAAQQTYTLLRRNPYLGPCMMFPHTQHCCRGAVVHTESCVGLSVTWSPGLGFPQPELRVYLGLRIYQKKQRKKKTQKNPKL